MPQGSPVVSERRSMAQKPKDAGGPLCLASLSQQVLFLLQEEQETNERQSGQLAKLAMLKIWAGKWEDAVEHCEKALELCRDMALAVACRAVAWLALGRETQRAVEELERAVEMESTSIFCHWKRGAALVSRMERCEEGKRELREALRLCGERLQWKAAAKAIPDQCKTTAVPSRPSCDYLMDFSSAHRLISASLSHTPTNESPLVFQAEFSSMTAVEEAVRDCNGQQGGQLLASSLSVLSSRIASAPHAAHALFLHAQLQLKSPAVRKTPQLLGQILQQLYRSFSLDPELADGQLAAMMLLFRIQTAKADAGEREEVVEKEILRLALLVLKRHPRHIEAKRVASIQLRRLGRHRDAMQLLDDAIDGLLEAQRTLESTSGGVVANPLHVNKWLAACITDRAFVQLDLYDRFVAEGKMNAVSEYMPVSQFAWVLPLWQATSSLVGIGSEVDLQAACGGKKEWKAIEAAICDCATAIGLLPEQPTAFYGLGMAYKRLGRQKECAIALRHSLAIEPSKKVQRELAAVA